MWNRPNYSPIGLDCRPQNLRMVQLKRSGSSLSLHGAVEIDMNAHDAEGDSHASGFQAGALKRQLVAKNFSGKEVVSTLPEEEVDVSPVKMTLSAQEDLEEAIVREAGFCLPYAVEEAVIDYLVIQDDQDGEGRRAVRLLLIAARRDHVDRHLANLRGAGLKPVAIEIRSCALARVLRIAGDEFRTPRLILDLDATRTTLTGLRDGIVLFERSIPIGLDPMVSRLSEQLKLDEDKSRNLLRHLGLKHEADPYGDGAPVREAGKTKVMEAVAEIILPDIETLAQEVEKVLLYHASEMRGERMQAMALAGQCSAIAQLDRWLTSRVQIPVSLLNPHRLLGTFEARSLAENDDSWWSLFSVPLGLAMRGLAVPVPKTEQVLS